MNMNNNNKKKNVSDSDFLSLRVLLFTSSLHTQDVYLLSGRLLCCTYWIMNINYVMCQSPAMWNYRSSFAHSFNTA